jgi:hypothetical protein
MSLAFILVVLFCVGTILSPHVEATRQKEQIHQDQVKEDSDDSHEKMVSVLVYLDNLDDTLENRDVLAWAAPLMQAKILVEFLTGVDDAHVVEQAAASSSTLVKDIMRTNCVLRSLPSLSSLHDAPPPKEEEVAAHFSRYLQKFDIVLVLACSGSHDAAGNYSQCWERVISVIGHSRRSSKTTTTSDDNDEGSGSGSDVFQLRVDIGPKSILYLPSSVEEQVCSCRDSDSCRRDAAVFSYLVHAISGGAGGHKIDVLMVRHYYCYCCKRI